MTRAHAKRPAGVILDFAFAYRPRRIFGVPVATAASAASPSAAAGGRLPPIELFAGAQAAPSVGSGTAARAAAGAARSMSLTASGSIAPPHATSNVSMFTPTAPLVRVAAHTSNRNRKNDRTDMARRPAAGYSSIAFRPRPLAPT